MSVLTLQLPQIAQGMSKGGGQGLQIPQATLNQLLQGQQNTMNMTNRFITNNTAGLQ